MVVFNLTNNNGEGPYIRLPAPHSHIIITPPRSLPQPEGEENAIYPPQPDIDASVAALNDDRVHPYLESPPYPYKREQAVTFHRMMYDECQRILQHPQQELYNGCPFRDIRDTSLNADDGSVAEAPKVGDILISRYPFYEFPPDSEARSKAQAYNASLAVGHEDLVWGIGCMHPLPPLCLLLLFFSNTDVFGSLAIAIPPRERDHERRPQHFNYRMANPKNERAYSKK